MLDQFVGRLTTDGPVRVRHHVCIGAKRQATILVTAGGQAPVEATIGAANATS